MNINQYINLFETLVNIEVILCEAKTFDIHDFLNKLQSVVILASRPGTEGEKQAAFSALDRMKIRAKAEALSMPNKGMEFLKRVDNIIASIDKNSKSEPPRSAEYTIPSPMYHKGQWVYNTFKNICFKIFYNPDFNKILKTWVYSDQNRNSYNENELVRATQEQIDAHLVFKSNEKKNHENSEDWFNEKKNNSENLEDDWFVRCYAHFKEGNSDKIYGIAQNKYRHKIVIFWGRANGPYQIKDYSYFPEEARKIYQSKLQKGYIHVGSHNELSYKRIKNILLRNSKLS